MSQAARWSASERQDRSKRARTRSVRAIDIAAGFLRVYHSTVTDMSAFERCRGNDMPVAISVLASCGDIDSVRTGSGVVVGRIELCQDTGPTAAGCSIRGGRMR